MGLDAVGIGISGLLAFQKSMATASHNITNADTEGYSRQRVSLSVNDAMYTGDGYVGTGTGISRISRVFDKFSQDNLISVTSTHAEFQALESLSSQLDHIFSNEKSGLSPKIQDFFISLQALSESPSSTSAKRQFISATDSLASRFNSMHSLIDGVSTETQGRIKNITREINSYASALSDLNYRIVNASSSESSPPNDLLDQRDNLLVKLSEKINIKTMDHTNGSVSVFIANGQSLVNERGFFQVQLIPNEFDNSQLDVGISTSSSSSNILNMSKLITSGELGAVLDFRNTSLVSTRNSLGRLAGWLTHTVNKQHAISVDENGNFGSVVFDIKPSLAKSSSSNTGDAIISVTFNKDIADKLTNNTYLLEKTATDWQITNQQTKEITLHSSALPPPISLDGMDISLDMGTPNVGDKFILSPTSSSLRDIKSVLNSPSLVATAYPITTSSELDYGVGISSGTLDYDIINASLPAIPSELQSNFNIILDKASSTFNIYDALAPTVVVGTSGYNPTSSEQTIEFGAWSFNISGDPPDGAEFNVNTQFGLNPSGDNRAILDLAQKQFENLFLSGTETIHGVYEDIVSDTGSLAHNASINNDAQVALLSQARDRREQVSGVNLDEEAASLIKLQQAYQAAAKVIQVADKMFQILMNTV